MRSVFSGSYSALNNPRGFDENEGQGWSHDVYRSTTHPSPEDGGDIRPIQPTQKFNVINSVRKLFQGSNGRGRLKASQSVFVLPHIHENSASYASAEPARQRPSGPGANYSRLQHSR